MAFPKKWLFASACASVLASAPLAQAAAAAEKAAAEALFDDGLRLMKAGSFAEACPKLESSEQIDPAVGTLLYLAECYEKIGRSASAWATFREAASLAQTSGQTDRAKTAQDRAARLEPELARLTIDISTEARAIPGLTVRRGASSVALQLSGVAVPVDPGEIVVEAAAPGHATFSTKLVVSARSRGQVSIPPLAELPASERVAPTAESSAQPAQPLAPPRSDEPAAPVAKKSGFPVLPVLLGGVGLVGIGVGSYFGLRAISAAGDARDLCPGGRCREKRGDDLMDDANSFARISNVTFGIGAGALAAGIVVYLLMPSGDSTAGFVPVVSPSTAGLVWRGQL
jgi:hypothetical protein